MPALLAMLLLAVSVKTDHTPLRAGCSPDDEPVATLPAGAALTIRFALSGESVPCYKVTAESEGKTFEGYLPASAIDGLEDFDKARQGARWLDAAELMGAITTSAPLPSLANAPKGVAADASRLIENSQPAKASSFSKPSFARKRIRRCSRWQASRRGVLTIAASRLNTGAARSIWNRIRLSKL